MSETNMKLIIVLCFVVSVSCKTIEVSDASELSKALSSVSPGDTIHMSDGSYKGSFEPTTSGTESKPITLSGSKKAIISGSKYGFWLKASNWVLKGFAVSDSPKGIVVEGGSNNILDGLEVYNIKQEGIHFRYNSADNILRNSYIHHTGQGSTKDQGFGEGVYIGQAVIIIINNNLFHY